MIDSSGAREAATRDAGARLLSNVRQEAWLVLGIWAGCLVWVVCASYLLAPGDVGGAEPDTGRSGAALLWGMPRWAVWGIALPWVISTAVTLLVAIFAIRDDDLGADVEEDAAREETGGGSRPC